MSRPSDSPTLAPPWVALATAWLGLIMLVASIVTLFLPGSADPQAELERRVPYSLADRYLPYPVYGIAVVWFLGSIVLWQMRKEPRPLPDELLAQRLQALVGIALATLGAVIIYTWVALRGPS
jgi:hypothetical protein